eukprot:114520-Pelagomonas_calceolata.AAC.1
MACMVALLFLSGLRTQAAGLVPGFGVSMLGSCNIQSGKGVGSMWAGRPGTERTKTASRRLWCMAGEPVPLGKSKSGRARDIFSGTSTPCSRSLISAGFLQIRDEPCLPLQRALTQKLRPTWCILSFPPQNGQQVEVEGSLNLIIQILMA